MHFSQDKFGTISCPIWIVADLPTQSGKNLFLTGICTRGTCPPVMIGMIAAANPDSPWRCRLPGAWQSQSLSPWLIYLEWAKMKGHLARKCLLQLFLANSMQVTFDSAMEYVRISETNPDGLPVEPAEDRPSAYPASARQLYAELPVDASSIRVLTLQPLEPEANQDEPPAPLAGQLHVVSMGTHPEFTALSYVWGTQSEPPETIECNGISI